MCAQRILKQRADEIKNAVERQGRPLVRMVTLTIRHAKGEDLGLLSGLLATAYGALKAGRVGQRLRQRLGWMGDVRAVEQTHGQNGWHPHIHALWFTSTRHWSENLQAELAQAWADAVKRTMVRAFNAALAKNEATLAKIIGARVLARLGLAGALDALWKCHVTPDLEHGCKVTRTTDGRYLSAMGLTFEALWSPGKTSAGRTAWEIARDAALGDAMSRRLWAEHYEAMRGKRQLTWSRDLRWLLQLEPERTDVELAMGLDEKEDSRCLARVTPEVWDFGAKRWKQAWYGLLANLYSSGRLFSVPGIEPQGLPTGAFRHVDKRKPPGATEDFLLERAKRWKPRPVRASTLDTCTRLEAQEELAHTLYVDLGLPLNRGSPWRWRKAMAS